MSSPISLLSLSACLLTTACGQPLPTLVSTPKGMRVCPGEVVLPRLLPGDEDVFVLTMRGFDDLIDLNWAPGVTSDLTLPAADRTDGTWLDKRIDGCGDIEFTYRLGALTPVVDSTIYPDEGGLLELMFNDSANVYVRVDVADDIDPAALRQTSCDLDPLLEEVPCPDPDAALAEVAL